MKKIVKLKLKLDLKGFKKGSLIYLAAAADGKPQNVFWRNRLEDGCVEEYKDSSLKIQKESFKKHSKKEVKKDDNI